MTRVLAVQSDADVPIGRIGTSLEEAGAQVRIVRAWEDASPLRSALVSSGDEGGSPGSEALLVLGGRTDAYADDRSPWLPDLRALIARRIDEGVPVLGICLGLQLMAVATGGSVDLGAAAGPEYGVTRIFWTTEAADDPLGAELAASTTVAFEDHGDAVNSLPPGAVVLARSARYIQVVRLGSAVGVQFHPEVTRATAEEWQCANDVTDTREILAGFDAHDAELAGTCRILARWLAGR